MKVWIYLEGKQQGPFEMEDLKSKPGFDENTRVWYEGLPKWYPAGSLDILKPLFDEALSVDNSADGNDSTQTTASTDVSASTENPSADAPINQLSDTARHPEPAYNQYTPGQMYRRPAQPGEPCPPTYIGWSVFLLICCCSPISLAALAASICVSTFYGQGNIDKAKKASEWAAWLVMISFALGMIPMMIVSALMG